MAVLKDSGDKREYETGAVRDLGEDKGRCDLMPLDIVGEFISSAALSNLELFKKTPSLANLNRALYRFVTDDLKTSMADAMLRVSYQFRDGAVKYGENNWQKGIPISSYIDSAVRHYLKWRRGDQDEPHDRAFIWNILCASWTFLYKDDLMDITSPFENKAEKSDHLTTHFKLLEDRAKFSEIIELSRDKRAKSWKEDKIAGFTKEEIRAIWSAMDKIKGAKDY